MLLLRALAINFFTLWKFEEIKEISHSEFKEMEEEAPQPLDKEKFV